MTQRAQVLAQLLRDCFHAANMTGWELMDKLRNPHPKSRLEPGTDRVSHARKSDGRHRRQSVRHSPLIHGLSARHPSDDNYATALTVLELSAALPPRQSLHL
jgi:hypothetical protein